MMLPDYQTTPPREYSNQKHSFEEVEQTLMAEIESLERLLKDSSDHPDAYRLGQKLDYVKGFYNASFEGSL